MGGLVTTLFGGTSKAEKQAEAAAAASQRTQLAQLANQQAEIDQAKAGCGRAKGRRLLTYLGGGDGSGTVG